MHFRNIRQTEDAFITEAVCPSLPVGYNSHNVQIEFLIDEMDIDEEYCRIYLDSLLAGRISLGKFSKRKELERMGSHPEYEHHDIATTTSEIALLK